MTYREIAIRNLRDFEGYSDVPYLCPAGYWTIGYGFNLEAHGMVKDGKPIIDRCTREQAETWLVEQFEVAEAGAKRVYPAVDLFPEEIKALVIDLVYNMGERTLRNFVHTNAAMNRMEWNKAAEGLESSRYYKQTGRRAKYHVATLRNHGKDTP